MRNTLKRGLALAAVSATSGALLLTAAAPASALDAGQLADLRNGQDQTRLDGSRDAWLQVTAPGPCAAAATRHLLEITTVTATNPADQAEANKWTGDNMYAPVGVGLPGPLTVQSSETWGQQADREGQAIVPGVYGVALRCQNNFGTVKYEEWYGSVTFDTPTHWSVNVPVVAKVATSTTVVAAPSSATTGETVTLTATVAESDAAAPSGTVEFRDGSTVLGSGAVDGSGVASAVVGPLGAGSRTISAVYAGDSKFASSTGTTTLTVTQAAARATSTGLTVNPTSGPAYQSVTLAGTVTDVASPVVSPAGTCTFTDGAATVATVPVSASGACSTTSAAFAPGAHNFKVAFAPTDAAAFAPSESAVVPAAYASPSSVPDEQTIVVTVPAGQLTIFTPYLPGNPLNLGTMALAADGSSFSASALFDKVTVTDTRAGNPGWSASLIRADFVGSTPADTIPARYSGFEGVAPSYRSGNAIQAGDVTVNDIPANDPAYVAGPARFATTTAGNGTGTVDITANFVLEGVPTSTKAGKYTSTVTFTVG